MALWVVVIILKEIDKTRLFIDCSHYLLEKKPYKGIRSK